MTEAAWFTGQMRDAETYDPNGGTALDWFNVRHMSGAQGRFQSVDPGNAGADPTNPQTWNMYAYVANNPLSYRDPSGRSWITALFGAAGFLGGFFTAGLADIPLILGAVTGAEVAGAQYAFEKAANSGNIWAIAGTAIGGIPTIPNYGNGFIFDERNPAQSLKGPGPSSNPYDRA